MCARVTEGELVVKFIEPFLDTVESTTLLQQFRTIVRVDVYTRSIVEQLILLSSKTQDLYFILKVEKLNEDGSRLGCISSLSGRTPVGPFDDQWLREVFAPQELENQLGIKAMTSQPSADSGT